MYDLLRNRMMDKGMYESHAQVNNVILPARLIILGRFVELFTFKVNSFTLNNYFMS